MPACSRLRLSRSFLGTSVTIIVEAEAPKQEMERWLVDAFECITRVERLMSFHDPESELTRLNRLAATGPVEVDPWTFQVLYHALELGLASCGALDVSIAPRLEKWGYLPVHQGVTRAKGGLGDIELMSGFRVRYHRPLRVDLGGIAKGFAVDQALECLMRHGASYVSVDAGGDLRQVGESKEIQHELFLRNPSAPHGEPLVVPMYRHAVATSAGHFSRRKRGFRWVNQLVHPRTGRPQDTRLSVSVFAPDCMTADALTKVVMFSEPKVWKPLLIRENAVAILITGHGEIIQVPTDNLSDLGSAHPGHTELAHDHQPSRVLSFGR